MFCISLYYENITKSGEFWQINTAYLTVTDKIKKIIYPYHIHIHIHIHIHRTVCEEGHPTQYGSRQYFWTNKSSFFPPEKLLMKFGNFMKIRSILYKFTKYIRKVFHKTCLCF